MYQNISTQGYVQLSNLKSIPEDSQTISTIDVFLTGAGITTDLITNNLALSRTIKNM